MLSLPPKMKILTILAKNCLKIEIELRLKRFFAIFKVCQQTSIQDLNGGLNFDMCSRLLSN